MSDSQTSRQQAPSRGVREDTGAGLFLLAVAALAWWQGRNLDAGTLGEMGPGLLPQSLTVMTAVCGVLIGTRPLWSREASAPLGRWTWRGPLFVLGAACLFAAAIRPLGFVVAGPAALLVAAAAGRDTRWIELLLFAIVMTAACLLLFRWLLALPIPVAPWLLGY